MCIRSRLFRILRFFDVYLLSKVLHCLEYTNVRARMSVICRDNKDNQIVVYSKGADSAIMPLLDQERTPKDVMRHTTDKIDALAAKVEKSFFCLCEQLIFFFFEGASDVGGGAKNTRRRFLRRLGRTTAACCDRRRRHVRGRPQEYSDRTVRRFVLFVCVTLRF